MLLLHICYMEQPVPITAKITNSSIKNLRVSDKRLNDSEISGFHARISDKGRIHYYLYYRVGSKQANYKLGTHGAISPSEARELAAIKAGEIARGVDVQSERSNERKKAEQQRANRLDNYLSGVYRPWLAARNPKTVDRIVRSIEYGFADFLKLPLEEINAKRIESWRSQRRAEEMKPATINRYINCLKGAMSRAVDWGYIDSHNLSKVKQYQVDQGVVRYLSDDETKRLAEAIENRNERYRNERDSANKFREARGYHLLPSLRYMRYVDCLEPVIIMAMNTGMRKGEIFSLKWSDINLEQRQLVVQADNSKSGKHRVIPLNSKVMSMLEDWTKQSLSIYVFEGEEGKPITDIKKSFSAILDDAKITNFRFHDFRHHFASRLVMAGQDLNTVRELLGHADLKMTIRYAHLAPEHKARAVELL